MRKSTQQRIADQRQSSRILSLWRMLQSLKSVVSFMNSGAHPDDETSSMLAALGLRDGLQISFACANRGEGGQNDLGTEQGASLGVLRTAEMEQAASALCMRLYWLSEHPQDSIFDFGFSKDGQDTLDKWQHARTLQRFVDIVRAERPDILCPTFLDIPGQHGHHRAMTQLADEVFDRAADASFHSNSSAAIAAGPWQISKLYLPAWSGAGEAYDDDLPPPPTTLVIDANGHEQPSGWSWAQIAQHSRSYHRSQGMGKWTGLNTENRWPLHLRKSVSTARESDICSGLPVSVADLAKTLGSDRTEGPLRKALLETDALLAETMAAWPDFAAVEHAASAAFCAVDRSLHHMTETFASDHVHRLERLQTRLAHVIRLSRGIEVRATAASTNLTPGASVAIEFEQLSIGPAISHAPKHQMDIALPAGWSATGNTITASASAIPETGYRDFYDPLTAPLPAIRLSMELSGDQIRSDTTETLVAEVMLPLEDEITVCASTGATLEPAAAVINRVAERKHQDYNLSLTGQAAENKTAQLELQLPAGWSSEKQLDQVRVTAVPALDTGLFSIGLDINQQQASQIEYIHYPHIAPRLRCSPARASLRVLDVNLPGSRVGYIGGGNDRVAYWLREIGINVTELNDNMLTSAVFGEFDTIVVGVFALRTRSMMSDAMPALHEWVNNGGHWVTLYHRPKDAWDPQLVPPFELQIGTPSLRWRVTDENAEVTHLLPAHPLLNTPNTINRSDWQHWHKERGLYFASHWHDTYDALLAMSDKDEEPLQGSLLSARVGSGRHTHCALILHHQMEKLVPGAFRIMANLVAPA